MRPDAPPASDAASPRLPAAAPAPPHLAGPAPLVSIVVVTYNAPEYVRGCVESIRARTPTPHELILVDNASEAPTRDYLRSLSGARLILNDENRLWCAGCNQGLRAADPRSRYFLLLNSDTEVECDDWLAVMVALMERHPRVGLVGPEHHRMRAGPLYGWLDGHCLLIRRALIDEVGYLDEARWPWAGAPLELAVAGFARGWTYKVLHPADRAVRHHERKSTSRQLRQQVLDQLPRPRPVYRKVMARYGLDARRRPLDRFIDHPWFGPLLERRRFYYAPPANRRTPRPGNSLP